MRIGLTTIWKRNCPKRIDRWFNGPWNCAQTGKPPVFEEFISKVQNTSNANHWLCINIATSMDRKWFRYMCSVYWKLFVLAAALITVINLRLKCTSQTHSVNSLVVLSSSHFVSDFSVSHLHVFLLESFEMYNSVTSHLRSNIKLENFEQGWIERFSLGVWTRK